MKLVLTAILALASFACFAQDPQVTPNAPPDKPGTVKPGGMESFEVAIAPYVNQAKGTYPAAKARFLAGLPAGQSFFVTTRIYDITGAFEQVFIAVGSIEDGVVKGRVWSDIRGIAGIRHGDAFEFAESEVMDWLITHPTVRRRGISSASSLTPISTAMGLENSAVVQVSPAQ